jgi:hypothetical protein
VKGQAVLDTLAGSGYYRHTNNGMADWRGMA